MSEKIDVTKISCCDNGTVFSTVPLLVNQFAKEIGELFGKNVKEHFLVFGSFKYLDMENFQSCTFSVDVSSTVDGVYLKDLNLSIQSNHPGHQDPQWFIKSIGV